MADSDSHEATGLLQCLLHELYNLTWSEWLGLGPSVQFYCKEHHTDSFVTQPCDRVMSHESVNIQVLTISFNAFEPLRPQCYVHHWTQWVLFILITLSRLLQLIKFGFQKTVQKKEDTVSCTVFEQRPNSANIAKGWEDRSRLRDDAVIRTSLVCSFLCLTSGVITVSKWHCEHFCFRSQASTLLKYTHPNNTKQTSWYMLWYETRPINNPLASFGGICINHTSISTDFSATTQLRKKSFVEKSHVSLSLSPSKRPMTEMLWHKSPASVLAYQWTHNAPD